jgi:hypothetical protein
MYNKSYEIIKTLEKAGAVEPGSLQHLINQGLISGRIKNFYQMYNFFTTCLNTYYKHKVINAVTKVSINFNKSESTVYLAKKMFDK